MPELNGHVNKNRSAFLLLAIQMAGMMCGFGIMLVIALYEHELSTILRSQLWIIKCDQEAKENKQNFQVHSTLSSGAMSSHLLQT